MPGLIESDQGLMFGSGLIWLAGGLGAEGLVEPPQPDILDRFSAFILDRFNNEIQSRTSASTLPEDVHDRANGVVYDRAGSDIQTRVL